MKCKEARRLIHELLDGADVDHAELDRHLTHCADCRAELAALTQVEAAVADAVNCEVPDEALEHATAGALEAIEARPTTAGRVLRPVRAVAMGVAILVVFGLGLATGRWVWPREVMVTQVVEVPEVREKIVKVEVPVVKERVVVKRVPVYKTRIVYREREVPEVTPVAERPREPVKCDEILVYLPSSPIAATAQVSEEVQPAEVLDVGESDEAPPTQGHWQQPYSTTTASAGAEMVIAQNLSD